MDSNGHLLNPVNNMLPFDIKDVNFSHFHRKQRVTEHLHNIDVVYYCKGGNKMKKLTELLEFESKNDCKLPVGSFVDYELKRKLRAKENLTEEEQLLLCEGFLRLNHLVAGISEVCVQYTKQHGGSLEDVMKLLVGEY